MRANNSGVTLTEADVALIKGMLLRGDRQHDIASFFGVNAGRIAEIATGFRFTWVKASDVRQLPPPGPYPRPAELLRELVRLRKIVANSDDEQSRVA